MNSFVHIKTIFKNTEDRKVNSLASVYLKTDQMESVIRELISFKLNKDNIRNKRVLLKPNWVVHSDKISDEICLRTNDAFVLATLKIILEMEPGMVIIGDAPIQGCIWDKMILESFINSVKALSKAYNINVNIKDFRRRRYNIHDNKPVSEIKPLSEFLIFDLGSESYLEPITLPGKSKFRVTNYDPARMFSAHSPGVHKYCIARDFFDADIVISMPKIKTHEKTGITGALKNIVGINGDKDFLPHHRLGGVDKGGDCYPGGSLLRYWSERLLDMANQRQGMKSFWFWQKMSSLFWRLSFPGPEHRLSAGWYGNDTTWRMVGDLNKIAVFGNSKGKIASDPQRIIYNLCDAIIAGQGDGPLEPDPLPLGFISFSDNPLINDRAMAVLMGLPIEKIPLLRENLNIYSEDCNITLNEESISIEDLKSYTVKAVPPVGWKSYLI